MIWRVVIGLNFLSVAALCSYTYVHEDTKDVAYIVNHEVFNGFNGTKRMKAKLAKMQSVQEHRLDSLMRVSDTTMLAQENAGSDHLMEGKSSRYSAEIWKRINQYVSDYGEGQGIKFIYGATGSGDLMYASKEYNITDEVIEYINNRYEGDE